MQEKNIFYHQRKLHFDQASSSANNLITKNQMGKQSDLPKTRKGESLKKKKVQVSRFVTKISVISRKLSHLILPMHLGLVRRVTDVCLFMRITDLSSGKSKLWERGNIIVMKNCPQYANAFQKQQLVSAAFIAHYNCSFLET